MLPAPQSHVVTIWREPFQLGSPRLDLWPQGLSVSEIVSRAGCLPADFHARGVVAVDGEPVPRHMWAYVRPKAGRVNGVPVHVTFHMPLQGGGGGGGGGKRIFAIVAAIALTLITAGISTLGIPAIGIAAGSLGAKLLATAVGIAGSLAITALSSPPTRGGSRQEQASSESGSGELQPASVSGNVLQPNAAVPRVIGSRRLFPPFAMQPIVELIGQDEYVEAVHVLAGPHKLSDIRLGETTWDPEKEDGDLQIELREGLAGESRLGLVTRYGKTADLSQEMSVHGVDPIDQSVYSGTTPVWHGMATADAPDQAWLHLVVSALLRQDDVSDKLRIPFRIRIRRRGAAAWRYLPELHYMDATQAPRRAQIKFRFGSAFDGTLPPPPTDRGFIEARKLVPGQDVSPVGEDFDADPYFSAGAGDDIYRSDTAATTNVRNVTVTSDLVEVYLSADEWPAGVYEIEVIRGATFRDTLFTSDTYIYDGNIYDFFGVNDGGSLPLTRDGLIDRVTLRRLVSVREQYPIARRDVALIGVRARNRAVGQLSVRASGYVRDYGGYQVPAAVPGTVAPVSVITHGTFDKSADIAFECSLRLPKQPSAWSVVWEDGGSGTGSAIYIDDNARLVARAGDGDTAVQSTTDDTVVLKVPIKLLPFDGEVHTLGWDIRVSPGRVRLWIDDVLVGEAGTTLGGSLEGGTWAGGDAGGYLRPSGAAPDQIAGSPAASAVNWDDPSDASDLSVWAGGELHDASAAGWHIQTVTSNPAPHFLDAMTGSLNADPIPEELVDMAGLFEWRQKCLENGYSCNMVAEGDGLDDLLRIISSCGYARKYQSELWGVIRDYDRSAEAPIQVFSPRNIREFRWSKAFSRLPAGLRINYREAEDDDAERQITVFRAGAAGTDARTEQVTYDGLTDEADIIRRASFDLAQAQHRSTFYSFTAPVEAIVCRRGSLVTVNHDILRRHHGGARIKSVILDGPEENVLGVVLDAVVEVKDEADMLGTADLLEVPDLLELGNKTGIAIRRADGTSTVHALANAPGETDTLTFAEPVPNDAVPGGPFDPGSVAAITEGCLVVVGVVGQEFKRLIVSEIENGKGLTARLTLVDEAPQIWEAVNG
ncbi:hypothetical protein H2509_04140 [Stappia sp. F7233]|uniref:Tip attachment protein J domain-containing protein n=1 Tax=Stappia albiluteola TaxID=2758565 RepID=A0A839ABI4_9HYPH|nr:hypothetical protein [Stappia albiluteola]MBA5776297.1 hypothetical protein [Stappia albiluteola]MBA5776312.1 hypothetical protein [Stappia albiluteola]